MTTPIKRGLWWSFCFSAVLVSLLCAPDFAVEIVPATTQDIMKALGPDARGLALSQEALPDLFALTASRIEENAKQFIVEEPYLDGRWKGGKAVIEYARDLSYTLVSVYDKEGHRERIYSVRTNFTEHIARQQDSARRSADAQPETQIDNTTQETPASPSVPTVRPEETAPNRKPPPSTPEMMSPAPNVGYEWDEASGSYVSLTTAKSAPTAGEEKTVAATATTPEKAAVQAPAPAPTPHHRKHHHREEPTVASAPITPTAAPENAVWIPPKAATSESPAAKVQVENTTWVERRPDSSPAASHPAEESPHPKHRRLHKKPKSTPSSEAPTVVASKPSEQAIPPVAVTPGEEWVPKSIQEAPHPIPRVEIAKQASDEMVPSTEELLSGPSPAASAEPKEPPSTPVEKPSVSHRAKTVVAEEPAPKAAPKPEPVQEAVPVAPPAKTPAQPAVPSTEELLSSAETKAGPDTSESDKWVPKAVPKPAVALPEAPEEPVKVAMIPKPAPVDNSVENLLKMANEGKSEMPHESDAWVPKKTAPSKPDVDISHELARIRAEEKKQAAPKPVVKIKHDINNPEEGVLPVSTFEKFSGPMYGRHREYERRFFPGKKARSKAPDHDFFVEEVDRKKEIHNIYFYRHQKGKAPKLVAVERHDKVSFLGNYDIEKEDKGKISTYN